MNADQNIIKRNKLPIELVFISYTLILLLCIFALFPVYGLFAWLVAIPILLLTFVLGIVAIVKNRIVNGIFIILLSVIGAPIFIIIAPILSTGHEVLANLEKEVNRVQKNLNVKKGKATAGDNSRASKSAKKSKRDTSKFHWDAKNGNVDAVKKYLESKGDINIKNHLGETPLHFAAAGGNKEIVELLINGGAAVDEVSDIGNTPLDLAIAMNGLSDNKEVIEFLLKIGARQNKIPF